MNHQGFEWSEETVETAYLWNKINAMELRRRMYALGWSPQRCDDLLDQLDDLKAESDRQRL